MVVLGGGGGQVLGVAAVAGLLRILLYRTVDLGWHWDGWLLLLLLP